MSAALPALFPTEVRYGSLSIGYNLSASLFGGTTPLVITALISSTGTNMMPAYYAMARGPGRRHRGGLHEGDRPAAAGGLAPVGGDAARRRRSWCAAADSRAQVLTPDPVPRQRPAPLQLKRGGPFHISPHSGRDHPINGSLLRTRPRTCGRERRRSMTVRYTRELLETGDREVLAEAVATSTNWTDLMRRLDLKPSGGGRRALQKQGRRVRSSTPRHFKKHSPWRKYPDEAIAAAAATSSTLREVVGEAWRPTPPSGTLVAHQPSHRGRGDRRQPLPRDEPPAAGPTPSPLEELTDGRRLGREHPRRGARARTCATTAVRAPRCGACSAGTDIDTSHFRNARLAIPEETAARRCTERHQLRGRSCARSALR